MAKNKAMLRIAEKAGFKPEGIIKKGIELSGRFEDEALIGMILASKV